MKTFSLYLALLLQLLLGAHVAQAQQDRHDRLDVMFEGPWIFYVEEHFNPGRNNNNQGGDSNNSNSSWPVLIAIAPQVRGHIEPVFTTGPGTSQPLGYGYYCVTFDGNCASQNLKSALLNSNLTPAQNDDYRDPVLVKIQAAKNWNWTTLPATVMVFILEMPDSVSSYGGVKKIFAPMLPSGNAQYPPAKSYAMGLVLHYAKGPTHVNVVHCIQTSTTPCQPGDPASNPQRNFSTLRMIIQSDEAPLHPDQCENHEHLAYHTMLKFLDPTISEPYNQSRAVEYEPAYKADCAVCDWQRDPYPKLCRIIHPLPPIIPALDSRAVAAALASLKSDFGKLSSALQSNELLEDLNDLNGQLDGAFPTRSQLALLPMQLGRAQEGVNQLLESSSAPQSDGKISANDLMHLRAIQRELPAFIITLSGGPHPNGSDCDAAVVWVCTTSNTNTKNCWLPK